MLTRHTSFTIQANTEGIAQGHAHGKVPSISITLYTINRRINRLDIKIKDTDNKSSSKEFKDKYILSSQ
jgi:hypothetical protein